MSKCQRCGGKEKHDLECPNADVQTFVLDGSKGQRPIVRLNADGSIDVQVEDDHYDFTIDVATAGKIVEAWLLKGQRYLGVI